MLQAATLLVFPMLMVFAAFSDLFTMTISNRVSLLLLAIFPLFAAAAGMGAAQIGLHLACGCGVLVITFGLFAMRWIGGGDAKLAAATAVWIGFDHLCDYGVATSMLGGALTLALLGARLLPLPAPLVRLDWLTRLHERNGDIPYGIALAAAGLIIYPETGPWFAAAAA